MTRSARRLSPALRVFVGVAAAAALYDAPFPGPPRGILRVYLLDVSGSVRVPGTAGSSGLGIDDALRWIRSDLAGLTESDAAALVAINARAALMIPPASPADPRWLDLSSRPPLSTDAPGTDLAGALRLATDLRDPARATEVVLLSDGRGTTGDAAAAAAGLAARGIRVAIFPLGPGDVRDARIVAVSAPADVPVGSRPRLRVILSASVPAEAVLRLRGDGGPLVERRVSLPANAETEVELTAPPLPREGLRAVLAIEDVLPADDVAANDRIPLRIAAAGAPRIRVLAADPAAWVSFLRGRLPEADVAPPVPDEDPAAADLAVLADLSAEMAGSSRLSDLHRAVAFAGTSLLVVGGRDALGPGGYAGSPIDPLLPVDPEPGESFAVGVLLDRSGSMGHDLTPGRTKWEAARTALARAATVLGAADRAGLLLFWDRHETAASLDGACGPGPLLAALDRLRSSRPTGGTAWIPPIETSVAAMGSVSVGRRHLLLITDGETLETPQDLSTAGRRVAAAGITLTVVLTGDHPSEEALAALLGSVPGSRRIGRESTGDLGATLREDWLRARALFVEGAVESTGGSPGFPNGIRATEIHRTSPRPGAAVLLRAAVDGSPEKVPVFVRRGTGRGTTAALLCRPGPLGLPSEGEGAAAWTWIADRLREQIRPAADGRLALTLETSGGDLVRLRLEIRDGGVPVSGLSPRARFADEAEDGTGHPLMERAPGDYEGTLPTALTGSRTVRVGVAWPDGTRTEARGSIVLPPAAEWAGTGPERSSLERLRAATGGSWIRTASPARGGKAWALRPGRTPWLLLGLTLFLADLLIRALWR